MSNSVTGKLTNNTATLRNFCIGHNLSDGCTLSGNVHKTCAWECVSGDPMF